jgi:hypothetical protein
VSARDDDLDQLTADTLPELLRGDVAGRPSFDTPGGYMQKSVGTAASIQPWNQNQPLCNISNSTPISVILNA